MVTQMNTKRILIFLAFAVGIPWIAILVIYLTVRTDDLIKVGTIATLIFGTAPALANVATRLITREGWGRLWLWPNFRRGWRFYLATCLLPLLAVIVGGGIFFLLFPQSFDSNLIKVQNAFASIPFLATNPWVGMLVTTLENMMLGLVLGVFYFGEEFGWRAYLLPRLMERFSGAETGSAPAGNPAQASRYAVAARKAALLVGLIWGVWHWPGQFMSMKVNPTMPVLLPLVFLASTCAVSVLLCWVTLRSGSVWPASIGHGIINAISDLGKSLMKGPAMPLLGPGVSGLIGGLGFLALALVLLFNRRAFMGEKKHSASEMAQEAGITGRGMEDPTLV
jgi:membrane protease YdiL (CAAX protease family)